MYQFSGRLKIVSIALMVLGAVGIWWGFHTAPKTIDEAKQLIAHQAHHGVHNTDAHHTNTEGHKTVENTHQEAEVITEKVINQAKDSVIEKATSVEQAHHKVANKHTEVKEAHHDDAHTAHLFHQMQNRPWAAVYVAMLFFLGISLLVLAFYAAQRVAKSGWSIVLFRVMEAITANLHYVSLFMIAFIILTVMHKNHLFVWMGEGVTDLSSPNYDAIIDGKKWWMNVPGWAIRSIIYLVGWNLYRWYIRRNSIKEDTVEDTYKTHTRNYNISVIFLVFFMLTESMAAWDWIMGIDPHWFSTLFGWYVLASLLVSAVTVIAFTTIYLRSKGFLPNVNDSHIHDLAKFMFGFSVFWTYLWFAQFMLIWYADMPEETTYYALRFNEYKVPFLGMLVLNFILPILVLLNSDFKSIPWFVVMGGVFILVGHYIDVFIMVMPGTVGGSWAFGIPELGGVLFFLGLLIWSTFSAFAKANPLPKGNPYLGESKHFHYYNIEHRGEDANAHH